MIPSGSDDMNLDDLLLLCIWQGHNTEAQTILEDLNLSDLTDGLGNTLLHFAAECGNSIMAKYFIDRGCNVDAVNNHGDTPLILASQRGHEDVIYVLLAAHASVLIANNQGKSAAKIILGETEVCYDTLDIFLQKVKMECFDDSLMTAEELLKVDCALPRAVRLKDTVITKHMLENGCRINDPDTGFPESTALHQAVRCSDLENVTLLIDYGADVNSTDLCGNRPLCFVKNTKILETLLDHGAQLITDDGTLVTGHLFQSYDKETIEMLTQYNLDFSAKDKSSGNSLLHFLILNSNFHPVEIIKKYIGNSFNINERNFRGLTPLMCASSAPNSDIVEFLLHRGAAVNITNSDGSTALISTLLAPQNKAVKKELTKIMMLLLQHGADVQLKNKFQRTLFDIVLTCKSFEMAKFLIAHLALIEVLGCEIKDFIRAKIDAHVMFKKYYNFCKIKIEKMKYTTICKPVSLFELLTVNEGEIAHFARHKQLISKVQSMMHYKHSSKLYYYKILRKNIMKIVLQAAGLQNSFIKIM